MRAIALLNARLFLVYSYERSSFIDMPFVDIGLHLRCAREEDEEDDAVAAAIRVDYIYTDRALYGGGAFIAS